MAKITLENGMVIEGTIEEFKQMGVKFPVEEKIGRKPNEFKKGDIVRVKNPCGSPLKEGDLVEVAFESKIKYSVMVTDEGWAVSVSELITPVEARFDR
jgi:hypothetical protein